MIGPVLECADLLRLTGYDRPGDAARRLQEQGVAVLWGKDGPFTTVAAFNRALGIAPANDDDKLPSDYL